MHSHANLNEHRNDLNLISRSGESEALPLLGAYPFQRVQRKTIRRSKFEIWAEIMDACARTARTQSWLLRRIGLKTKAIKEALDFLLTTGLIEQLHSSDRNLGEFQTSAKGEEALTQYYQLVTKYFVNPLQKMK